MPPSQYPEIKSQLAELVKIVNKQGETVDEIYRILRGTEDRAGLIGRIIQVENGYDENQCDIKALDEKVKTVQKTISGDEKEIGVIGRLRDCEKFMTNIQRWTYLIVGAVIVDFFINLWPEILALLNKP